MGPGGPDLVCKVKVPTTGASYLLCRIHDPEGVRHINVTNVATGVREQSIAVAPRPPTKTVSFRVNMTGDDHRVAVTDLAGNRSKFRVADDGTVTPI